MKSVKLEEFRTTLNKRLVGGYPDYKIDVYFNTDCSSLLWLRVVEVTHDAPASTIAEVIAVEKFTSRDDETGLLVINYVNSDSRRFLNVETALSFMECILSVASARKKANENEGEWQPWNHIPISADKITAGTIDDINKVYLVTGRRNGKTMFYQNVLNNLFGFKIKDVIFNDPATIVFWGDGEKTVVQCQNGEVFDPEKGLAMAISKKIYGNKHAYYDVFKQWVGKYKKKKFQKALAEAMKITPDEIIRDGHRYALIKDGTEVTDNGVISSLKLDETGTVLKPFCDIKIDNSEKPEDNNEPND